ncbi:MAG: hypothetical protein AB1696_08140 [Planctomycetota bacterium]
MKRKPGHLEQILTILCVVALAVIVRPLLRGLAVIITDVLIAAGVVLLIYATLRRGRRKHAPAPPADEGSADEAGPRGKTPVPLPPTDPKPERERPLDDADRKAEIETELRELKRKLGKD